MTIENPYDHDLPIGHAMVTGVFLFMLGSYDENDLRDL